jgi:hypothetical protein
MKRILLATATIVAISSNLIANTSLHLKGFHKDIPFTSACEIMSSFKTQRGEFIMDSKNHKCGFGRNGFIAQPYILGDSDGGVKVIRLSPDTVDYLFGTQDKKAIDFVKALTKEYDWINDTNPVMKYSKYKYKDTKDGWEIIINKKKWMDIKFFNS